ncbi:leucine-rich repeat and fibronectin type-III domain-containing protein 5-like [Nymphalis io]|uniref:leucine-rich repeat and fibronectin type-III domain-containing protein 5-like n=1 Tax=Inachis io TaxID=171585 RepID=UPI00216A4A92|nr:leucine-rich repeat and fibronectin type-III domain-containing protein 5-like [Nymphalis io]XP_050343817.1 leucine-rich repeat and fibronectin type-III domain-containing protein 5-like [Nymphalis io]
MITVLPSNFLQHSIFLKEIDLSHNFVRHIPSNSMSEMTFPGVIVLNISSNSIKQLLETYPIQQFPHLEELVVTNTNLSIITSKDFENFNSLRKLVLTHNLITLISPSAFLNLHKLETLDLSKNKLENIPTERLQGLYSAKLINISRNTIRELQDFASDLQILEILDLSFNHISRITKDVFQNLANLRELYLSDNWLSKIVSDIFSKSKTIAYIDLSRNYFQKIPFEMLRSLEMQIETIAFDENPMACNCESQDLWIWMQDHKKITLQGNTKLRCEYPENLYGFRFLELPSQKLCDIPVVIRIAIQDIQTYSVLVSWHSRNQSGLNGYQVAYFREQMPTMKYRSIFDAQRKNSVSIYGKFRNELIW